MHLHIRQFRHRLLLSTAFATQHVHAHTAPLSNEPPAWLHGPRCMPGLRADALALQKTGHRGAHGSISSTPHQTLLLLPLSYRRTAHHLPSAKHYHSTPFPIPPSSCQPQQVILVLLTPTQIFCLQRLWNLSTTGIPREIMFLTQIALFKVFCYSEAPTRTSFLLNVFIYYWYFIWLQGRKLVSHRWDCSQWLWKLSHLIPWLSIAFQHVLEPQMNGRDIRQPDVF